MTGAAQRYEELRTELVLERALSTGPLPQNVEARYAAELQRCWDVMTDEEQERVEELLATAAVPAANDDLEQEDDIVPSGGETLPRRAAA